MSEEQDDRDGRDGRGGTAPPGAAYASAGGEQAAAEGEFGAARGRAEPSDAGGSSAAPTASGARGTEAPGTEAPGTGRLSERDLAILAAERRGWPGQGAKERAIRERLGLSPTRYHQLLNALLDDPDALAHDPVTVNRLRRRRDEQRARR